MIELICAYKKRWFLSYLIGLIVIYSIFSMLFEELPDMTNVNTIFLLFHFYIVFVHNNKECQDLEAEELQRKLNSLRPSV
jgi:positive regulator of sigma E activity